MSEQHHVYIQNYSDNPYLDGWLFVKSSQYLNNSNLFLIGVLSTDLSKTLQIKNSFINGNVHIFPTNSWNNLDINIKPATGSNKNYTYFQII